MNMVCKNCCHWKRKGRYPKEESNKGYCRRRSPKVILLHYYRADEKPVYETVFPETAGASWCGEFGFITKASRKGETE